MSDALRSKILSLIGTWETNGSPGHGTLHEIAESILRWRSEHQAAGLWKTPPRMMGATLDDAWGMGINLIFKYAQALGIETRMAGFVLPWKDIADACRIYHPDYLGLTVLQLDTEDDLIALRADLPRQIKIIAGGPAFRFDPELQHRVGIDFVAKDLIEFLRFMVKSATET